MTGKQKIKTTNALTSATSLTKQDIQQAPKKYYLWRGVLIMGREGGGGAAVAGERDGGIEGGGRRERAKEQELEGE